jgi:hypothetical protein
MKDGKDVSTTTLTVSFKDGSSRTFMIGGPVYGGTDKYVMDQTSGKAYVLSRDMLAGLEVGESSLHLIDPRGFEANKIGGVTLEAGGKSKSWVRVTTTGADPSTQVKVWAEPGTKKADQTATNFIDNANNLRPTEYVSNLKVSDLTPVMKLTYKDERGALLGTLSLYKREKPGQLAEGQELDPANPPKGETEYYIMTEKTRVPAIVRKDTAQRSENDIETVFSGKQPEPKSAVEPHGNPFGGAPPPAGPHGAPGGMPPGHGLTPGASPAPPVPGAPGAGSAAKGPTGAPSPAGAGSAAKAPAPAGAAAGTGTKAPTPTKTEAPKATTPTKTEAPKATTPPKAEAPKAATPPKTEAPKPAAPAGSAAKPATP